MEHNQREVDLSERRQLSLLRRYQQEKARLWRPGEYILRLNLEHEFDARNTTDDQERDVDGHVSNANIPLGRELAYGTS